MKSTPQAGFSFAGPGLNLNLAEGLGFLISGVRAKCSTRGKDEEGSLGFRV